MGENMAANLEVIPTGNALGAEVCGVDLSKNLPDALVGKLTDVWAQHLVLLFRDQEMTDDLIIKMADYFGGHQAGGARMRRRAVGLQEYGKGTPRDERINYVSNLDDDGKPAPRNVGTGSSELRWHSDNTYAEVPPTGTLLWAGQVPDDDSGQTLFCNQVLAYEELPNDLRRAITGKHFRHDGSRTSAEFLHSDRTMPKTLADISGAVHPALRIHPVIGKPVLFLGLRSNWPSIHIVEMPNDEGEDVMGRLWAHATQEKYVWAHRWRPRDLLMWDNRAVMHRRTAINPDQPRVMHRTLIKGDPVISAWEIDAAAE
jgi:taurine dioxygenase